MLCNVFRVILWIRTQGTPRLRHLPPRLGVAEDPLRSGRADRSGQQRRIRCQISQPVPPTRGAASAARVSTAAEEGLLATAQPRRRRRLPRSQYDAFNGGDRILLREFSVHHGYGGGAPQRWQGIRRVNNSRRSISTCQFRLYLPACKAVCFVEIVRGPRAIT